MKKKYKFLTSLTDELRSQDKRGANNACFWIMEDIQVYNSEWEYSDRMEDYDYDDLCESCNNKIENNEEIPNETWIDWCECDEDMFYRYDIEGEYQINHEYF